MNSIGSWLAENGIKHALVINKKFIGSVIALVSFFRQSRESLYLDNVLGDIKYIWKYLCLRLGLWDY